MHKKDDTVIGVLGGMGPEATASFFYKLIRATNADQDQDHYRIIIDNNPKVPDRTKAILGEGKNPVPTLIETARNIEKAGADLIAVPCITSFYFMEEVQRAISIPIIDVFEVLENYLKRTFPEAEKVGVLCTTGTRKTELFSDRLSHFSILYPNESSQELKVMEAIYGKNGIKKGNTGIQSKQLLQEAAQEMIDEGASVIISGCTEIELALKPEDVSVPLIDPMDILAEDITM